MAKKSPTTSTETSDPPLLPLVPPPPPKDFRTDDKKKKKKKKIPSSKPIAKTKQTKTRVLLKNASLKKKRKQLVDKAVKLPAKPGVYLWIDEDNQPLYLGKAVNLKKRAKHHVQTNHSKIADKLTQEAKSVVHQVMQTTPDELSKAEKVRVRALKPKYNALTFY